MGFFRKETTILMKTVKWFSKRPSHTKNSLKTVGKTSAVFRDDFLVERDGDPEIEFT